MEKIKRNGRKGAAMLIALLVFFLAALSGTVALTMAASNAGRFTHSKEDQQAYLSVMSAVQAIKSEFAGGVSADIVYLYDGSSLGKESDVTLSKTDGLFGCMADNMGKAFEYIAGHRGELTTYNNGSYRPPEESAVEKSYQYFLKIGDPALNATMGDVAVGVSLNLSTAQLAFDVSYTGNGGDSYHVKMKIGSTREAGVVTVTYPTYAPVRIKVLFYWDNVTIQAGS